MKTYLLYHKDTDGFGAAWAAHKKLPSDTIYIPVNYHEPIVQLDDNSNVYIVDFSYPRDVLLDLNKRMNNVVVLDHHKTAQKDLEGLDFCIFDMNKSGAMISWEYFNSELFVPAIIEYVEDFDLWKFNLIESKIINSAINALPHDFKIWDEVAWDIRALYQRGLIIRAFIENQVFPNIKCDVKDLDMDNFDVIIGVDALKIGTACVIYPFISDVNEYIHKKLNIDITMTYYITKELNVSCSLRSYNDFDVSVLAKKFGGGGHKSAAGFQVTLEEFKRLFMENI